MADPQDRAKAPCYDARALTRMYDHLTSVSRHMNALGWANYANDHEDANGQFEQNFRYADPMTTADRVIVFRYMVHIAGRRGRHDRHLHAQTVLAPDRERAAHAPQPLGSSGTPALRATPKTIAALAMSAIGYSFIAGLLEHAEALTAVTCPTVNSYKRLASAPPDSGRPGRPSFATYGGNDRTHMLRVPEPGRVEDRCIDGAANPYLALSALMAAGLDGVERGVDPGGPCELNLLGLGAAEAAELGLRAMPMSLSARRRAPRGRRRAARGPGQDARR